MKLNDDQREVLQALLDGKTVLYRWTDVDASSYRKLDDFNILNVDKVEYRIEEPAIKVALFELNERVIAFTTNENILEGWTQISDWVEVTPTRELK